MPTDLILEDAPPFAVDLPRSCAIKLPKEEKEKKVTQIEYLGLWVKDHGFNEPVAYFLPDVEEKAREFATALYGTEFILAKVKIDSRPLVTRSNLRGAKNLILTVLGKDKEVKKVKA